MRTQAIARLCQFLDDDSREESGKLFEHNEYVEYYTVCYDMCTQRTPFNWSDPLYQRHGEITIEYLQNGVLPRIEKKMAEGDLFLLKELVHKWDNHLLMSKWMCKFFMYVCRRAKRAGRFVTSLLAGRSACRYALVANSLRRQVPRPLPRQTPHARLAHGGRTEVI